jgi:hypothetical protein
MLQVCVDASSDERLLVRFPVKVLCLGLALALATFGCTNAAIASPQVAQSNRTEAIEDLDWFATLVEAIRRSEPGEIRVDPRPLTDRTESLVPEYVELTPSDTRTASRLSALRHLGVVATDAVQDAGCGGLHPPEVFPPPRKNCPEKGQFYSIAIGTLEASDSLPPSSMRGSTPAQRQFYRIVFVTIRSMTPQGSTSTKYRYWLKREQTGENWQVVGRIPIHFTD